MSALMVNEAINFLELKELLQITDGNLASHLKALEENNAIAGGGYIEKTNESFFIRAEGQVKTLEEIGLIVVDNRNGTPIYVRDLGKVGFGHANRFGAITANGQGEKVLGQVMMLKNADSKATIERVKAKLALIAPTLPEGIGQRLFGQE
jgi:cobalt-zinc-cadmium resistance protein CzcA